MKKAIKSAAILICTTMLIILFVIPIRADYIKGAKVIQVDKTYSVSLPARGTNDYKIEVPDAGNITFSLEGYSNSVNFILYDDNGSALNPTNIFASIGGAGGGQSIHYTWNTVSEKYAGTVTYKVDKGTYYARISRGNVGVSSLKLGISFTDLDGNRIASKPASPSGVNPNFKLLSPTPLRDILT